MCACVGKVGGRGIRTTVAQRHRTVELDHGGLVDQLFRVATMSVVVL